MSSPPLLLNLFTTLEADTPNIKQFYPFLLNMAFQTIKFPPSVFMSSSIVVVVVVASFATIMLFISLLPWAACGSYIESSAVLGNETDRQSLLAFKNGLTGDPHGALSSWNQSVHFCQWAGVTCGRRHQRVVVLELDDQGLKGPISPHIGNLSFLRELWLRNNSLEQQIPPELGRLRRLREFSLYNNSIGGEIPVNISECSNLFALELSFNNLECLIPASIGNSLSKLEMLYLGNNHLAGVIPATLGNLSSLRVFYASRNNLLGSIPDQFGKLKKLEVFALGLNMLVGDIPPSMFNISSVTTFDLGHNQLRGSLPSELGGTAFPSLESLNLGQNLFHGAIPVSMSNASNLRKLDLGSNSFTGKVPSMKKLKYLQWLNLQNNALGTAGRVDDLSFLSSLTNTSFLSLLALDHNNFGGKLPHSIGNFSTSSLHTLYLNNNKISGSIPNEIGNLVSLQDLRLSYNRFMGSIPSTIVKLSELRILDLSINRLTGTIPPSFGNLSLLLRLFLENNNLHGPIPSSIGKCNSMLILTLFSNNLHGTIPREIFSISSLFVMDLRQNQLIGSLPAEIGGLMNLVVLNISNNQLSGKVPTALGRCVLLNYLDMGTNNFGGTLPASLSSLRGLDHFDLSNNNFSGTIPDYLGGFNVLEYLNLSFNDFEGDIPTRGIFGNTTAFDVEGNIKLCGGVPQLQLPRCNFKTSKNLNVKLVVALTVVGVFGVILLLCVLYLCISKKSTNVLSLPRPRNSLLSLSYQSLWEATNGFSESNLIGVGSFGSVYKGLLDQDQQMVAVKVLNLQCRGVSRSFIAECEALRRIRHRNLLKVITACSSIDHQGNDFKALVYEFMPNGSLDDWLHPLESQEDLRNLNLHQRIAIVVDVASALEYLHDGCSEPVVHCDLKPSNVLLDSDMIGHVGDFGLAKFLQEGATNQSSENQSSTLGLRGSVGYVAPEYGMGNEVSTWGDVYSYGILLLEMFTGKRPTDHQLFNDCLNLHDFVKLSLPDQVTNVADSRLLIQPNDGEDGMTRRSNAQINDFTSSENIKGCLVSLLEVGIACSRELPGDRMTIRDAIVQLNVIKKALVGVQGGGRAGFGIQLP